MLNINPNHEILRGWKLNLTVIFISKMFGKRLGLDMVIRVELSSLNTGGFIRRGRRRPENAMCMHFLSITL